MFDILWFRDYGIYVIGVFIFVDVMDVVVNIEYVFFFSFIKTIFIFIDIVLLY